MIASLSVCQEIRYYKERRNRMKRISICYKENICFAVFVSFFVILFSYMHKSEAVAKSWSDSIISFGVFADVHYMIDVDSGDIYCNKDGDAKLIDIIEEFNKRNLPMAFELGDFIYYCGEVYDEAKHLEALIEIDSIFKNFKGKRHYVLGNHDLDIFTKAAWLSAIEREGLNYYSFDKRGWHFIILDTMYKADGTDAEKGQLGGFEGNELYISQTELDWLKNDLLKSQMKPTVVFTHVNLYIPDHWEHAVRNAIDVRDVLEKNGNVQLVVQGHYHPGRVTQIWNGIHYFGMKAITEEVDSDNAYSIITVRRDGGIVIEVFENYEDLPQFRISFQCLAPYCDELNSHDDEHKQGKGLLGTPCDKWFESHCIEQ